VTCELKKRKLRPFDELTIEPALQAAETARSAGRPTTDLTAYDLYLRASAMFSSSHCSGIVRWSGFFNH
jgi:hypothetical protein